MTEPVKVLRLTDKVDDVRYETVRDCLERALAQLDETTAYDPQYKPTSCVVVLVDQSGGKYHIKDYCSAMRSSEEVAMLEVCKHHVMRDRLRQA